MKQSLATLALAGLPEWFAREARAAEDARPALVTRRIGPNDTLGAGGIGVGGRGLADLRAAAQQRGCRVVALCDVDAHRLAEAAARFPGCAAYPDYREVLARPDVDAVVVATPDHWHARIAADALWEGKDVYCEKPLTLTVAEGRYLVTLQRKTHRILQVGSQQRSDPRFRLACELYRNGRLGRPTRTTAYIPRGVTGGPFPTRRVPEWLDWDLWLGQAPWTEYVPERTHGTFRRWFDYSGGTLTDWGAHHNDIAQWALGLDASGPMAVQSVGELPHIAGGYEVPLRFTVTYDFPGGVTHVCTTEGENGVLLEGEAGWVRVWRGGFRASDERLLTDPLPSSATRLYASNDHMGSFLDCVRSRRQPVCCVEAGHRAATLCHLGVISLRLGGRRLGWNARRERITPKDEEATAMLAREQRQPYALPPLRT